MIIEPKIRGFICLTSHPAGCAKNIQTQINYIKSKGPIDGPKKVLVIGASTGFGLASRISSAFGSNAATIGVFLKNPLRQGNPDRLDGIILLLFKMKLKKQAFMLKVLMVTPFLTR